MKRFLMYSLFSVMALSAFTGCRKDAFDSGSSATSGTTFVRFVNHSDNAPLNSLFFAPFTDKKAIQLADLRRDAASPSSLKSSITVSLVAVPDSITSYNTAHGTNYELLPESMYTLDAPGYTKTATGYTVTFNAGELAKPLNIKLDGSLYDLSKKYAIAFKLGTITGDAKATNIVGEKTIMTTIGIKNKYDGVYTLTGYHNRVPYNFPYETEVELRTLNANTVAVYWPDAGAFGHPIGVGPGNDLNWYGTGIGPAFTFDLSTDEVTNAYNIGGATLINLYTAGDGTEFLSNKYDAATKTLSVSWKYANRTDRAFFDTFKYEGPRN